MASDTFVRFKEKHPTRAEALSIIRNFFGEGPATIDDSKAVIMIDLVGQQSFPFKDFVPERALAYQGTRWIEVDLSPKCLVITTRQQDEYTHVLAEGLAALFHRYYAGSSKD